MLLLSLFDIGLFIFFSWSVDFVFWLFLYGLFYSLINIVLFCFIIFIYSIVVFVVVSDDDKIIRYVNSYCSSFKKSYFYSSSSMILWRISCFNFHFFFVFYESVNVFCSFFSPCFFIIFYSSCLNIKQKKRQNFFLLANLKGIVG